MTKRKDPAGRLQLFLISLVFFGPLILAAWLYFSGEGWRPAGRTNHGELLEPLVNIGEVLPGAAIHEEIAAFLEAGFSLEDTLKIATDTNGVLIR